MSMQPRNTRRTYASLFVINGIAYATLTRDTPEGAAELGEKVAEVDPDEARRAGIVQVCTIAELQSVLAVPKIERLLAQRGVDRRAGVRYGLIVAWFGTRGWIIDREGRSWRAPGHQLLTEDEPAVGMLVTFAGSPHPANGHDYPLAWSIRTLTKANASA